MYPQIRNGAYCFRPAMEKLAAVGRRLRRLFQQKPIPSSAAASTTEGNSQNLAEAFEKKALISEEKEKPPVARLGLHRLFLREAAAGAAASDTLGRNGDRIRKFKRLSIELRWQLPEHRESIRRLIRAGKFSRIDEIVQLQKQYPEIKDERFAARLITIYGKAKMLDHALKLFNEMPELDCPRTAVSFNALLAACFPSQNFDKLIELFRELPAKISVEPDVISYTSAMEALCKKESFDEAVSLVEEMAARGINPDATAFDVLLYHLYHNGRFVEGEKVWNMMKEKKVDPDPRCYNSRLSGMIGQNRLSQGVELVQEMVRKGLSPKSCTFRFLIEGFIDEGNVESEVAGVNMAFMLCKKAIDMDIKLSHKIVRRVSNELVNNSRVEDAKELLHLFNSPS